MKHRLLATKTVVAPIGAPRHVYGLSIVVFESEESLNVLYGRLRAGYQIELPAYSIERFESESPSLLMTEFPLLLTERPAGWLLSSL